MFAGPTTEFSYGTLVLKINLINKLKYGTLFLIFLTKYEWNSFIFVP